MLAAQSLNDFVKAAVKRHPDWTVGVSLWLIEGDQVTQKVEAGADRPLALASVFKLPILFELMRQIDNKTEGLSLSKQLVIHESDKCVGSGSLKSRATGTKVSVDRCVELMETISDNTATDMIFRLIGFESVNVFCKGQGCQSTDIQLTNRAAWLLTLGQSSDVKGKSPSQIAAFWKKQSPSARLAAAHRVEKENERLTLSRFQALENASESQSHEENVLLATTVENFSSSNDLALLLAKLYQKRLLSAKSTQYCLGVLARQKFNTRIPKYLPEGVTVYHKTGTLAGVVNDAGLIDLGDGRAVIVVALVNQIGPGESAAADDFIGTISARAYESFR